MNEADMLVLLSVPKKSRYFFSLLDIDLSWPVAMRRTILASLPFLAGSVNGACYRDSCLRALAGAHFPIRPTAADCSSFLATTITPDAITLTAFETSFTTPAAETGDSDIVWLTSYTTVTADPTQIPSVRACPAKKKRALSRPIPSYAPHCDAARYASACKCIGVHPFTLTAPTPLTTITLTTTLTVSPTTDDSFDATVTLTTTDYEMTIVTVDGPAPTDFDGPFNFVVPTAASQPVFDDLTIVVVTSTMTEFVTVSPTSPPRLDDVTFPATDTFPAPLSFSIPVQDELPSATPSFFNPSVFPSDAPYFASPPAIPKEGVFALPGDGHGPFPSPDFSSFVSVFSARPTILPAVPPSDTPATGLPGPPMMDPFGLP
jgi:hypothetical protein